MANEKNLKPFTSDQSREKAVKNGRKGGIASGESKRRKKELKELLEIALDKNYKTKDGEISGYNAITVKLIEQALKGNIRAYTIIRDTLGQAPVQKIQTSEVDPDIIKEVEQMIENESDTMADTQSE